MKRALWFTEGLLASIVRRTLPVHIRRRLRYQLQRWQGLSEVQIITAGWERYARLWKSDARASDVEVVPSRRIRHLGDEWTAEMGMVPGERGYFDLPLEAVHNFEHYIESSLLEPYLPPVAFKGLEIGPGGGRLTALLLPRTKELHVAEPSATMLQHLRQRFADTSSLRLHHTDGTTLPALGPASLDYVFAFDVFVHFEPRLIYWYLQQIEDLLKPGGTGLIHYANVCTSLGWRRFISDLKDNLHGKQDYGAFGVMCPQLMVQFLEALQLEVISDDIGLIPRDAIAVFRKPI